MNFCCEISIDVISGTNIGVGKPHFTHVLIEACLRPQREFPCTMDALGNFDPRLTNKVTLLRVQQSARCHQPKKRYAMDCLQ